MSSVRILMVEDEGIVALDIRRRLEKLDYVILNIAESGRQAIEQVQAQQPDLILMDVQLKGELDGIETAELIRAQCNIPIVYLTAYADEATLQRAKVTEPYGYIVKPFHERELQSSIEIALYKHRAEMELRRVNRALRVLGRVNLAVARATDETGLLNQVCNLIVHVGGYRLAWVGFAEQDEAKTVRPVARAGYDDGYLDTIFISWDDTPAGQGPTGTTIRTRRPAIAKNINTDPDYGPWREAASQRGYGSSIALPLTVDEDTFGALNIYATEIDAFDMQEFMLLTELADSLAYGIVALHTRERRYLAEEALERRVEVLSFMNRIGQTVTSSLNRRQVLQAVMEETAQVLHTQSCSVLLYDPESNELAFEIAVDSETADIRNVRISSEDSIAGWALRKDEPVVINDVQRDEHFCTLIDQMTGTQTHSLLAIPLRSKGQSIGVIEAINKLNGPFTEHDINLLSSIAQWAAIAIDNAQLFDEANRRYEELQKAQSQLVQSAKMAAIGELAAGVAHDFNNLLTVIQGYTELLLEECDASTSTYQDLAQVHDTAGRAAALTTQLLAFSRKQTLQPHNVDLNHLIAGMKQMLQRLIGEDIALLIQPSSTPALAMVDPGQIEQVILNLVVNARDAMPHGGKLVIETSVGPLSDQARQTTPQLHHNQFVCISVSDTGTGITPEILNRIFEPFFTTKERGKGTGLGLSVAYGIIQQHDGCITVRSTPGQGTTFDIYVPLNTTIDSVSPTQAPALQDTRGHGERVLIVEDDPAVCRLVSRALREHGYDTIDAHTAQEALKIFTQDSNLDLVFSDAILPDQSGLYLLDQIVARKPDIGVMLGSGYANERLQWQAILDHGIRFARKPYALDELLRTVRQVLDAKRPQ
ncbi:MAG: GAF domain-containing protein [Anaerolineae bacterium]|nr:GAF domain-containing protein [Anaerolineae bacterium]